MFQVDASPIRSLLTYLRIIIKLFYYFNVYKNYKTGNVKIFLVSLSVIELVKS